ncbi:MAG: PEP-CTERM sorting domain-containing protein [Opitutales bacterium]|nr:PEP-CTERM sorting domain-containing protein [Opitutales bacterium]
MKKTYSLLACMALVASTASAQVTVVYSQTFNNTVNATLINIPGWNWAVSDGGDSASTARQFSRLSNGTGIGGTAGFVYNAPAAQVGEVASLTWYNGATFSQDTLDSLSVFIGHNNNANETRFVIEIDGAGWFTTTQAWTNNVGGGGNFASQAVEVSLNFTTTGSAWRPLAFDGNVGAASTGFAVFSGDQSANALETTLPAGTITAVGVYNYIYNYMPAGSITRFDDFAVAIPEPSTYAAILGLLALGLLIHRRRRA